MKIFILDYITLGILFGTLFTACNKPSHPKTDTGPAWCERQLELTKQDLVTCQIMLEREQNK